MVDKKKVACYRKEKNVKIRIGNPHAKVFIFLSFYSLKIMIIKELKNNKFKIGVPGQNVQFKRASQTPKNRARRIRRFAVFGRDDFHQRRANFKSPQAPRLSLLAKRHICLYTLQTRWPVSDALALRLR